MAVDSTEPVGKVLDNSMAVDMDCRPAPVGNMTLEHK
jgi:hypothetical protein